MFLVYMSTRSILTPIKTNQLACKSRIILNLYFEGRLFPLPPYISSLNNNVAWELQMNNLCVYCSGAYSSSTSVSTNISLLFRYLALGSYKSKQNQHIILLFIWSFYVSVVLRAGLSLCCCSNDDKCYGIM